MIKVRTNEAEQGEDAALRSGSSSERGSSLRIAPSRVGPEMVEPLPFISLSRRSTVLLITLVLASVAVQFTRSTTAQSEPVIELAHAQLIAFPIIAWVLFHLRIHGHGIPRAALGGAIACVGVCTVLSYSYRATPGTFLLARLPNDEFEVAARQFRERVHGYLEGTESMLAQRYHRVLKGKGEVRVFVEKDPNLNGVVWEQNGWVAVSLPVTRSHFPISEKFERDVYELTGLHLVTNLAEVGMSFQPENESAAFVATLLRGLRPWERFGWSAEQENNRAHWLIEAGSIRGAWSSFQHVGYPWWVLGNMSLSRALSGKSHAGSADIQCALDAYSEAGKFVRIGTGEELYAAASNNYAVALMARVALFGGERGDRAAAQKRLSLAIHAKAPLLTRGIVYSNWKGLKAQLVARKRLLEQYRAYHLGTGKMGRKAVTHKNRQSTRKKLL